MSDTPRKQYLPRTEALFTEFIMLSPTPRQIMDKFNVMEAEFEVARAEIERLRQERTIAGIHAHCEMEENDNDYVLQRNELEAAKAEIERLKDCICYANKTEQSCDYPKLAERDSLIKQMLGTLQCCRDKFSEYVKIHKAKIPEFQPAVFPSMFADAEEKVKRNQDMVDLCDAAIEAAKGGK